MSFPPSRPPGAPPASPRARPATFRKKILLDSPTAIPALGYRDTSRAFAKIISQSEPRFAIGIFGGWGSGKTTMMKAIKSALPEGALVTVDFNAWRFEREPQLLVPLLDTIRAAIIRWSEQCDASTQEKVSTVITRIGRVVRALATGLSGQIGIPGSVKISYDVNKALDALSSQGQHESAQSLYVAAFQELEKAFDEFSVGGVTRIVVFVDDLDRCLPGSALDLLESMKLFFDLPGFVFVVGLDEDIVERAVYAKFPDWDKQQASPDGQSEAVGTARNRRLGREYVKKIFQVPYSLPAMVPEQLDDLLKSMYREAALGQRQLRDLQVRVRPYLEYIAVERRVNPREVKRFINAYTLQTLVRPELDPDTVLALQTLAFRYEWQAFYDVIFTGRVSFVEALRRHRAGKGGEAFNDLLPTPKALPNSLVSFLRSDDAEPLVRYDSLDPYVSSLHSARSTWDVGTEIWDCPNCGNETDVRSGHSFYCEQCGLWFEPAASDE